MNQQEKFEKLFRKYPHPTATFSQRPHLTRRHFLNLAGTGVTASWLPSKLPAAPVVTAVRVPTLNKAKNCFFILLPGAPSHTDTFDFKFVNGTTPSAFSPDTSKGVTFPAGLMPKLAGMMDQVARAGDR